MEKKNYEILSSLCKTFLPMNVSSILYLMNYEKYGRSTASAQYFLQLAGYLGIPVIAWNADNSGLERRASQSNLQLQLAPSLEHQTAAMLSILERYKWHQFSVVTSQIAGHDDFIQAVRERIIEMEDRFKYGRSYILKTVPSKLRKYDFSGWIKRHQSCVNLLPVARGRDRTIIKNIPVVGGQSGKCSFTTNEYHLKFTLLNAVLVTNSSDLIELVNSESRVMLLYATSDEANGILKAADEYKIIGENYVWVVTQSVIENLRTSHQFPIGMLGVHFDTSGVSLVNEISTAIKVFAHGVENYINDPRNINESLNTQLSCKEDGESRWKNGERFYKHLRNVSIEGEQNKPRLEFTPDGVLKAAELKIMNLRRGDNKQLVWEEIGVWKSWEKEGLDIKDIVWPGNSHTPPQGVPEKFHVKITFLEEAPYISLNPPDPVTGKCNVNRGVLCRVAREADMNQIDITQAYRNETFYQCCSGFCIDLLSRLAEELAFTYELIRVEDGRWGTLQVLTKCRSFVCSLVSGLFTHNSRC
ncbi:hypothetical protein PGB90_006237 [Kerria lacca]